MREQTIPERVKTTFFLAADVHHRLRMRAAEERTSMVELLNRALTEWLERGGPAGAPAGERR
jgi:hypothetical protein